MAEGKESFILYRDLIHTVRKMPRELRGDLFLHILEYVNDLDPTTDDPMLEIAFEPIKQQLKRDLKKWGEIRNVRSENGRLGNLKRWNKDLYSGVIKNEMSLETAENIALDRKTSPSDISDRKPSQTIANVAVNDIVTVSDTVNRNENKTPLNPPKGKEDIFKTWIKYRKEIKKPIKSGQTMEKLVRKFEQHNLKTCEDVVNASIENQWQGLFWDRGEKTLSSAEKKEAIMRSLDKPRFS